MLNLRDVLQLVNHRFDDRPFAREQLVSQPHQFVLHVAPRLRKELNIERFKQLLGELLRDVAFVSKDFAAQDAE